MAEFSQSWSPTTVADFGQFDLNRDGIITARECLTAKENGALRGVVTAAPAATAPASGTPSSAAKPKRNIDERYMRYAQGQINKYDNDSDGVLSADEVKSMSRPPTGADDDGDGKITLEEFTTWYVNKYVKKKS